MENFKKLLALIFFVLICASLTGAQPQDDSWTQSCDPRLQKALEKRINGIKLNGATEHENLSIVVVDITNVSEPRMAYVNPNKMMYAASLPKIAILLGAFEKIAAGEMTLDDETLEKLKQMIQRSSNTAASEMLDRVGIEYLADPQAVISELGRVLRPGAVLVITFSNRCFPTKAIRGWLSTGSDGHVAIVRRYFELTGRFGPPTAQHRNAGSPGDPLHAVWATT